MLKTNLVRVVLLGSLASVLSLSGTSAVLAETYEARCYHSVDKNSGYDKCSILLDQQILQIQYRDEELKQHDLAIDVKNISDFNNVEISRVDGGRIALFGLAGAFFPKKYQEYTINYLDGKNGPQFAIFRVRDKNAAAFKAQLSTLVPGSKNTSGSKPEENSVPKSEEPKVSVGSERVSDK